MSRLTGGISGGLAGLVMMLVSGHAGAAETGADAIKGVWLTASGQSHVRIAPCGAGLCGDIVWIKSPAVDDSNPDPAKRGRSLVGVRVLADLKPSDKPGRLTGEAYNTADGKTYLGYVSPKGGDQLVLEGCILGGLFCKTQVWTRVK